jgi:hypothetical protein
MLIKIDALILKTIENKSLPANLIAAHKKPCTILKEEKHGHLFAISALVSNKPSEVEVNPWQLASYHYPQEVAFN